jgi:hypothetical protein
MIRRRASQTRLTAKLFPRSLHDARCHDCSYTVLFIILILIIRCGDTDDACWIMDGVKLLQYNENNNNAWVMVVAHVHL